MLNAESPAGEIRDRRFVQTTAKAKLRYTCLNKRKELKRGDFATGSKNCCLEKSVALELQQKDAKGTEAVPSLSVERIQATGMVIESTTRDDSKAKNE